MVFPCIAALSHGATLSEEKKAAELGETYATIHNGWVTRL